LAIYALGSLANFLLTIPQYIAVDTALQLGISPQGTTMSLIVRYGSSAGLVLEFLQSGLIFQGILAILLVGAIASASAGKRWKWQYTITGVLYSAYLGYHLGGKFLNSLDWIDVLHTGSFEVSSIYAELFWFGLATTICYLLVILVLRRSYEKLAAERNYQTPLFGGQES